MKNKKSREKKSLSKFKVLITIENRLDGKTNCTFKGPGPILRQAMTYAIQKLDQKELEARSV